MLSYYTKVASELSLFELLFAGFFVCVSAVIESIKQMKRTKTLKNKIKTLEDMTRYSHVVFDGARGTNGDVTFVATQGGEGRVTCMHKCYNIYVIIMIIINNR